MTLVQRKGCFLQKNWASKAFAGLLSYSSDNEDHENPLELNEFPTKLLKIFNLSPKTPANIAQYTKKDLKQIIQIVF